MKKKLRLSKYLFIIAFIVLGNVSCEQASGKKESSGFQNDPEGFRGIRWGTDINSLKDMVFVRESYFLKRYTRQNEKMKIGVVNIEDITYEFFNGKLKGVDIVTYGTKNFNLLKDILFEKFGEVMKKHSIIDDPFTKYHDKDITKYQWGEDLESNSYIELELTTQSPATSYEYVNISFNSSKILNEWAAFVQKQEKKSEQERLQERKRKAKAGSKDF
jgi:hypothetical protein